MRDKHSIHKITVIIISMIIAILGGYNLNKYQVIQAAKNHLAQKYTQEMRYLSFEYSWFFNSSCYYIFFSTVNEPNLDFHVRVHVQRDFKLSKYTIEEGEYFSVDDYYIAYSEYLMKEYFENDIKELWDSSADIEVRVQSSALYSSPVSTELNEQMPLEEIIPLIDEYRFLVNVMDCLLDADTRVDEADKIFRFIKKVQESPYKPDRIVFWYQVANGGLKSIGFDQGEEIASIDQVLLRVDEDVFSAVDQAEDKYYVQYFTEELARLFKDDAIKIWGEGTQITAKLRKKSINEYKIVNLSKHMSVIDVEYKLKDSYDLDFIIPYRYDNGKQKEEAERIFDIIQIAQKSGYTPYTLTFYYLAPDNYASKRVFFSRHFTHGNWSVIDSLDPIFERLGEMWEK